MDADTIYRRRWLILSVTCLSLVLVVVSVSSLNVALPTMQRQLSATGAELQWIIDSYGLVFAGLLLPAGALGDRLGRKRALQFGLVLFGVAAGLGALAQSPTTVIIFRSLMGVGAAFIMPATRSPSSRRVFHPTSAPKPSPSGPASRVQAAPSAPSPAACSWRSSTGPPSS